MPLSRRRTLSHRAVFLRDVKTGTVVSNIELRMGGGGQVARAAGVGGKVYKAGWGEYKMIKLPSLRRIKLGWYCRAVVGANENAGWRKTNYSKAGTSRRWGRGIFVRGMAMNAVDHPHGGKSGPSRTSVSPWGWVSK